MILSVSAGFGVSASIPLRSSWPQRRAGAWRRVRNTVSVAVGFGIAIDTLGLPSSRGLKPGKCGSCLSSGVFIPPLICQLALASSTEGCRMPLPNTRPALFSTDSRTSSALGSHCMLRSRKSLTTLRGNHLSNTTCLTHDMFLQQLSNVANYGDIDAAKHTHISNEAVLDKEP